MRMLTILVGLLFTLVTVTSAYAQLPAVGFDLPSAQGVNEYFFNFYGPQVLGSVFNVVGDDDLIVTHLGAFDMNPDNEPYWDVENPALAEHGFQHTHGVALFERTSMNKIAEVFVPAGDASLIMDEGYRYMPLNESVVLTAGSSYVLAAWWAGFNIEDGGVDTFYLLSTSPGDFPSPLHFHDSIEITEGCFNPNGGDGSTVEAPFIFNMYWGLYAGGANLLVDQPVATESSSWDEIKTMYR